MTMELGEGMKKFFLLGVGAAAVTVEKSSEIVDDLVKKGERTLEQGKIFNQELQRSVKESADKAAAKAETKTETVDAGRSADTPKDFAAYVAGLSAEERKALREEIEKAQA